MSIVEELRSKKSRDNRDLLDRAADRIEELELLLNQNKSNNFEVKSNKQIEEMAKMMVDSDNKEVAEALSLFFVRLAETLYNAGYRKQKQEEKTYD